MASPQRQERRDIRYPLNLPVSVKLAHKEMHARSENISLRGILLSSAFLIPEGSTVEVAVGAAHRPDPGIQLSARGKVLRVQPKASGNFAVAIAFERPFGFGRQRLDSGTGSQGKEPRFPKGKDKIVTSRRLYFAPAWHTET
jgi:hypothetical protein